MSVNRTLLLATDVLVIMAGQAQTVTRTLTNATTVQAPVSKATAR